MFNSVKKLVKRLKQAMICVSYVFNFNRSKGVTGMKYATLLTICVFLAGCTTRTVSNTPRTAIEQLLLSTAVDTAFNKLSLPKLTDAKVYLDFSNLQSYDSGYAKSVIQAYIALGGAIVLEKPDEADYIIQISCGALGNEYKDTLFGIPGLPVPGSPTTLPELALWKRVEQDGIAKFLVTVYSNGKIISTKHYYGKAERDESFFLWMRSQPKDDIRKAWEKAEEAVKNEEN